MKKLKVIFRKTKNPNTKENEVIAFFLELKANYGNILTYMHNGQHSEANLEFYYTTKKATEEEYKLLLNELKDIYNDYTLIVKQKLNYNDLINKVWE